MATIGEMNRDFTLLDNGGTVLVVGGMNKSWESFKNHPRVIFWSGDQKEIARYVREKTIPSNCKAVIISRFISHTELNILLPEVRKRATITLFPNKADGEVAELLEKLVPKEVVKKPEPTTEQVIKFQDHAKIDSGQVKGKLVPLIPFINFSMGNAECARLVLMPKALELGIATTLGSLSQLVINERKKRGNQGKSTTAVVKSTKNKLDVSVDMLDGMIKDLEGMRDYLIELTEENRIWKAKYKKMKEALEE